MQTALPRIKFMPAMRLQLRIAVRERRRAGDAALILERGKQHFTPRGGRGGEGEGNERASHKDFLL